MEVQVIWVDNHEFELASVLVVRRYHSEKVRIAGRRLLAVASNHEYQDWK